MKKVIEIFGAAVLCMVSMVLGWTLFFHVPDGAGHEGALQIIGAQLEGWGNVFVGNAFEAFGNEAVKEYPQITCLRTGNLTVGTYGLNTIVSASDNAGSPLEFLVQIREPGALQGYECTGADNADFTKRGIYTLRVEAKDAGGRKSVRQIELPVN